MDRRVVIAAAVAALALAAGGALLLLRTPPPEPRTPLLSVRSTPAGAHVKIGGVEVGQTPYYCDNRFDPGPQKLQLTLSGYRAVTVQFDGGEDVSLDLKLVRPVPSITVESVSIDAGPDYRDPDLDEEAKAVP